MPRFLGNDAREQQKYEKRMQTSVDSTVNDLRHEIKFEDRVKNKSNFSIMQNIYILNKNVYFFYSWKSIFLRILRIQLRRHFFAEADIKKTDMSRQKHRHLPTTERNFER